MQEQLENKLPSVEDRSLTDHVTIFANSMANLWLWVLECDFQFLASHGDSLYVCKMSRSKISLFKS